MESNIERPDAMYYEDQGLGSEVIISANVFSYRNSQQCGAPRFSFDELYWMELYGQTVVASFATWKEPVYLYQEGINQTAWPGYEKWVTDDCVEVGKTERYDAESGRDVDRLDGKNSRQEPSTVTPEKFYRVMQPN